MASIFFTKFNTHAILAAAWDESTSMLSSSLTATVTTSTHIISHNSLDTQTDTRLTASFTGQPGYIGTRNVKPVWILMKQGTMGWQWHQLDHIHNICTPLQTDNYASTSLISFYSPDALHDTQPTVSEHRRHNSLSKLVNVSRTKKTDKDTEFLCMATHPTWCSKPVRVKCT